ncbi:MAG: hypothetical protein K2Q06_06045, partial [Parvularculaceae bacterium]|nr:hypothetical protein [Parvularculaceae bacterium]
MTFRIAVFFAAASLGACTTAPSGLSVAEFESSRDWISGDGASEARAFDRGMGRALRGAPIADAIADLRDAGYECETGEAHERHPDPMTVCRWSFATRACQLDKTVVLSTSRGVVRDVEATFERDCVG